VRLATGERVRLDVVLEPGAVSELVTIVQDASLLRTESGGLGQVITNRKIVQAVSQRTLDNINPAFVLSNGPSVAPIPNGPDAGLGQGVFTVDRDLGSGYAQQWNFAVQRELTKNMVVEVAYAGSKITHVVFLIPTSIN